MGTADIYGDIYVEPELLQKIDIKLEIRSVKRGICPIAKSTMNELFL